MKMYAIAILIIAGCRISDRDAAQNRFGAKNRVDCIEGRENGIALCIANTKTGNRDFVCFAEIHGDTSFCIPAIDPLYLDLGSDSAP